MEARGLLASGIEEARTDMRERHRRCFDGPAGLQGKSLMDAVTCQWYVSCEDRVRVRNADAVDDHTLRGRPERQRSQKRIQLLLDIQSQSTIGALEKLKLDVRVSGSSDST